MRYNVIMKEEILQTIREQLAGDIKQWLHPSFDLIEGFATQPEVKSNLIIFDLLNDRQLHIDLAKKLFTIVEFKFDHYRDPCPGYVYENEVDVTQECLKLIGDLADIMVVFSDRTAD